MKYKQRTFNPNFIVGGGQIEPCEENISEKWLRFHHKTALEKNKHPC